MGLRDVLSASIIQEVSATAAHVMLLGERGRERDREGGWDGRERLTHRCVRSVPCSF